MVHGHNLVYNTCWEDPRLDKTALELGPDDNLLVITSAGCNALSYALSGLNHVYAVDMNYRQNAVLELKIAGIKELDYETFFLLFGKGKCRGIKEIYKTKLRDQLSESSRRFWDKKIVRYFDSRRKSFYFCGTTGAFARGLNFFIDRIGRFRKPVNELLECTDLDRQRNIWENQIRKRLWSWIVKFMVNRDSTLSLLGVPRAQRLQIEKTYPGGIIRFVQDCLDAVFGQLPIADNYFWRAYATGSYTKECCPEYLEEKNFQLLKNGLADRISVHTNTVEGFLREYQGTISRFVLLDHMDWLSDRLYDALVSEWDAILQKKAPKTRILWRSGGLSTDYIQTVPVQWKGGKTELGKILRMNEQLAHDLHQKDRVHTYGSFYIADLEE
ncbi:MAG: BtaA family protein [Planctomycetia bacterium]|nr:BtaA family protein [Planctomycetia bacterium]